ncbi:MAG: mannose-1-phosphate guanylyltransferase [Deltaproteobacteria bacterium]|nr:mannose-1-phosphate guanylyltransferase [Deltaproteobacteria bacterium]
MYAVIMCGGSGTRFWPVSRREKPKQFLNITGHGPMVVETCDRLRPLIRDEATILVLGKGHRDEATACFEGRGIHILAEPVGRNTAPCMGLGAIYARYLGCRDPVAFLPADHFIGDREAFLTNLERAGEIAANGGIVTLGIVPNRPETGYGYIRKAPQPLDPGSQAAYPVKAFVEKPDIETAMDYIASGEYYWNGGIFVATPETILSEMEKLLPDLHAGLMRLEPSLGTDRFGPLLEEVYGALKGVSFDYGIMEKTTRSVYVVPSACGWSDVGSWASLYELREKEYDDQGNLCDGDALTVDCERSLISAEGGRLVACLGLKDCLVVDTPDAVLVADQTRSQDIRKIVDRLKAEGREELL